MKTSRRSIALLLLVSALTGAGAGIVASITTSRNLDDYAASLLEDTGYGTFEPKTPTFFSVGEREARERVAGVLDRSLVQFTSPAPLSANSANWLTARDVRGLGVAVSADGWTLTTKDQLASFRNPMVEAQAWVRGQPYDIEQVIGDTLTEAVLIKLKDASNLSTVGFAQSEEATAGEGVFVGTANEGVVPLHVIDVSHLISDGPVKGEFSTSVWQLSASDWLGPVFAPSGDLIGFSASDDLALPIHQAREFVDDVIRTGSPTHAALGAYVVHLDEVLNVSDELRQNLRIGALVTAVGVATPASEGDLEVNDVITAMNGEPFTSTRHLSDFLSLYEPGQTVRLTVYRDDAQQEVTVTLENLADLLY